MAKKNEYKITALEGIEAVRQTSGMYIGNTEDGTGYHHMLMEVLDNSVDEYLAGHCNKISVTLHKDGSASVGDNGRGIPTYYMSEKKMSALEVVFCTLHAGGKFDKSNYKISGGLHGVGVSVVNALSARLKVVVRRDGKEYSMAFEKGKKAEDLSEKNIRGKETGTFIRFGPDLSVFKKVTKFDSSIVERKLLELSFLCRGLEIEFSDERKKIRKVFGGDNDISGFVEHLAPRKLLDKPIVFTDDKSNIVVDVGLQWLGDGSDIEISKYFTNNIPNPDGGSHTAGFKSALTRTVNSYISSSDLPKSLKMSLSGDDIREGLISVVSIRHPDPKFSSQTKEKLVSEDARTIVEGAVSHYIMRYLEQNPGVAKKIVTQCVNARKAREAAKKAREAIRKSALKEGGGVLPGKLADCSSRDPEKCELFVVEGDSAGGCFSGDTKVALVDGRNLSFKELVDENELGKNNYCYSVENDGSIGIRPIKNPRLTKRNCEIIRLVLDNGEEIVCTPAHMFLLENGEYIQAQNTLGKSLMPLYRKVSQRKNRITISGYEMVFDKKSNRWVFTHLLSDRYNQSAHSLAPKSKSDHLHHIDFNKLNNNPTNICRMEKSAHLDLHRRHISRTLHTPEAIAKSKAARRAPEFRQKMSDRMKWPETASVLSANAKRQWDNPKYKDYMAQCWREFCDNNPEYVKANLNRLNEAQKNYWSSKENRDTQAERVKNLFEQEPERKLALGEKAKEQWSDEELRTWRSEKTRQQWTDEFRKARKEKLAQTYFRKTLSFMKKVYDKTGSLEGYREARISANDKNLLRIDTFMSRYFNNDYEQMIEAVRNFNHKVIKIINENKKIDVYDIEVPQTHNFALASGVFVHNSAKQGRDRGFQAILPLRGKVLNVERCEFQKMMKNEELTNLITAIGVGIGKGLDLSSIRYKKVIIMTDSDVDGAHIRTLLLTFFFRQMPQLIHNENIYIAQPPLYRVDWRKNKYYIKDDSALQAFVREKNIPRGQLKLQRFKGLGEMSPDQLWNTTMDPNTRSLLKVMIKDYVEADKLFNLLMGNQVEPRRQFISERALKVNVLDT